MQTPDFQQLGSILAALLVLAYTPLKAQEPASSLPSGEPSTRLDTNTQYAQREQQAWRDHAQKLTAIDAAQRDAIKALSEENRQRLQAISASNSAAHKQLAKQDLSSERRAAETRRIQADSAQQREELRDWYAAQGAAINAEHKANRTAQAATTNGTIEQIASDRAAAMQRLLDARISSVGLTGSESGASDGAVQKSADTPTGPEDQYKELCSSCHGSSPGTRQWPGDLYETVVDEDASFFLDRVRNGPGAMPRRPDIQALSDAQILAIRDYIRERGDIETGLVEAPVEKTPDAEPEDSGAASVARGGSSTPSGVPPIAPDSPLPGGASPAGSDAARQAQADSLGTATLTCNLSSGAKVSWLAPFSWKRGWIPPGATMSASEANGQDSWMVRLTAKLEDSASTDSGGSPAPGWCTFTDGSLGNAAGPGRRITVFAHTVSQPFEQFEFDGYNIEVWRSNTQPPDRGGKFALDVVWTVQGLRMPAGNQSKNSSGQVSAVIKRIDDRWADDGNVAFLVVDN